jgi:hypothetical protein
MHMATYQEALRIIQPIIKPISSVLRTGLEDAARDEPLWSVTAPQVVT